MEFCTGDAPSTACPFKTDIVQLLSAIYCLSKEWKLFAEFKYKTRQKKFVSVTLVHFLFVLSLRGV